ncbi:hypothetical protein ACSBOB_20250 [Mesorhizobium sp. ASY16-5R]|uniref:hypothetical protein n=1 Tax=Mesorhizobium sp. ASY16-5R TaxID=3445772 RepID=UPI003FA0BCC0
MADSRDQMMVSAGEALKIAFDAHVGPGLRSHTIRAAMEDIIAGRYDPLQRRGSSAKSDLDLLANMRNSGLVGLVPNYQEGNYRSRLDNATTIALFVRFSLHHFLQKQKHGRALRTRINDPNKLTVLVTNDWNNPFLVPLDEREAIERWIEEMKPARGRLRVFRVQEPVPRLPDFIMICDDEAIVCAAPENAHDKLDFAFVWTSPTSPDTLSMYEYWTDGLLGVVQDAEILIDTTREKPATNAR